MCGACRERKIHTYMIYVLCYNYLVLLNIVIFSMSTNILKFIQQTLHQLLLFNLFKNGRFNVLNFCTFLYTYRFKLIVIISNEDGMYTHNRIFLLMG